ncbi:hypothetical protein WG66_002621, partial [Moniliophthora roreri]
SYSAIQIRTSDSQRELSGTKSQKPWTTIPPRYLASAGSLRPSRNRVLTRSSRRPIQVVVPRSLRPNRLLEHRNVTPDHIHISQT